MAYDGYLSFGGVEIVNRARLNAYMSALMPNILKACECECDDLAAVLGDYGYSTPFGDDAPWIDPDDPDSAEFYGAMVNSMKGLTDSVATRSYAQSIGNGGAFTGSRRSAREVRFVMTLFAGSDAGMASGWSWFKSVLQGECSDSCSSGSQLCFFSACPPAGAANGPTVTRDIHKNTLTATSGTWDGLTFTPSGTGELRTGPFSRPLPCGPIRWSFTVSGTGDVYAEAVTTAGVITTSAATLTEEPTVLVVSEENIPEENAQVWARIRSDSAVTVHKVEVTYQSLGQPGDYCADDYHRSLRDVGVIDGPRIMAERETPGGGRIMQVEFTVAAMSPHIFGYPRQIAATYRGETAVRFGAKIGPWSGALAPCEVTPYEPLLDPNCLPLAPLPTVPDISVGCSQVDPADLTAAWLVEIPGSLLPEWREVVPVLSFRTDREVRGVRARFFPRPTEEFTLSDIDPCAACGQFEVSYIPTNATMTIDGMNERVLAEDSGGRVMPAGHLVSSGMNNRAFTWPELSCGVGYFLLVEVAGDDLAGMSLSLVTKE